jgi:hypothetical protein
MAIDVGAGDVLAVNTGNALFSRLIRLGEALRDQPNLANHVVIAHHRDAKGTWWGIEGRPGGVGWAQLDGYLADTRTAANTGQPRTDAQRDSIAKAAEAMLGVGYDWVGGILCDALDDVACRNAAKLVDDWWGWRSGGARPGHVVCSSLAAYVYKVNGLAHPSTGTEEVCQPSDWWAFNNAHGWQ